MPPNPNVLSYTLYPPSFVLFLVWVPLLVHTEEHRCSLDVMLHSVLKRTLG